MSVWVVLTNATVQQGTNSCWLSIGTYVSASAAELARAWLTTLHVPLDLVANTMVTGHVQAMQLLEIVW